MPVRITLSKDGHVLPDTVKGKTEVEALRAALASLGYTVQAAGPKKRRESRADRFQDAMDDVAEARSLLEDAKSEIEALKGEIETWKDNMEGSNMEHLPKYDEVSECYDAIENVNVALEEAISAIENAEGESPNFPGMY